ncbi:iron permease [Trametes versicolor FP-101664 SS1]|uniref:iron permease n=1 Tax=Trametes versicolor (strain FP-101664) TaxID=717944 RepID=UPI0004622929|nr:iron permease [Trametes versicolor FP-101664 SS1]EIW57898.1 iron permease [Trametes versicolor FP-101664 SS1]
MATPSLNSQVKIMTSPSQPSLVSPPPPKTSKGSVFWLSFTAVVVCNFLSALDVTAVSTALPTITDDLKGGDDFVWVGAAYGLAAASILPFSGRAADILGRRPVMMVCVGFFFVGSALAGSAQSMNMLIAARTIQGVGGGGITNLTSIITSDLVPLAERGIYQGFLVLTWAFAAAIGPVIGGSLAEKASWRWLFYLNLPLAGTAFVVVAVFLRVRTPPGSLREKLARIDWRGNLIIIIGTTLALVGLTWGGIQFPWNSAHVLAPLIIGGIFIAAFFIYEFFVPKEPTLPFDIMTNRSSLSGYISTFFHGIVSISIIYYLPVYFQACQNASPIRSSIDIFGVALVCSPFSLIGGVVVKAMNKYRPVNYAGWALTMIGVGLLSTLKFDSGTAAWVGFQVISASGFGIIWACTIFPILAPLSVTRAAAALAFYNFCRTFAQTWGVAISASILQNELKTRLPAEFVARFPAGIEIAYAAIPVIRTLDEPLRTEVRIAFAESMAVVWKAMIGFSAAGFLTLFLLREVPMQKHTDETYGLQDGVRPSGSVEEEGGVSKVNATSVELAAIPPAMDVHPMHHSMQSSSHHNMPASSHHA